MSIEERATAYVLGALSPGERDEVAREKLYNVELAEQIGFAEQLFAGLQPDDAPAPCMRRDFARIAGAVHRETAELRDKQVEACSDGDWQPYAQRIDVKPLWSPDVILIRCNPGAVEDVHDQPSDRDEHILVIAGDLDIGGRRFGTGDYIRVPAGSVHARMETHGGCLLFTEYCAPAAG